MSLNEKNNFLVFFRLFSLGARKVVDIAKTTLYITVLYFLNQIGSKNSIF